MADESETQRGNGAIDPRTSCDHVRLLVPDLDRSVAFYRDAIGLALIERSGGEARLGAGGRPLLRLAERPDAPGPPMRSTGLFHLAILVPTRRDLGVVLRHLAGTGVPLQGFSDHHVSEAIYLADPDGNGIEIYRDRPRDGWRDASGEIHMVTEPLDIRGVLGEAGEEPHAFEGLPDGTVLGHVHVKVAQVPAAERFYCDVLGLELMARYGRQASFVAAGGYHHHVGMNTWLSGGGAPPPAGSLGLDWFALRLPDPAAVAALQERLRAAGVAVETSSEGVLTADPSGNRVLLLS